MQSCFAACSQVICVAEDTAVAFYSTKSLHKYRVERLNGSRVCGIHVQTLSSTKAVLHVIDAEATWFEFSIEGGVPSLVRTRPIRLPPAPSTTSTSTTEHREASEARQRGSISRTSNSEAVTSSSVVVAAGFHMQRDQLFAVLLTKSGLYEAPLNPLSSAAAPSVPSAAAVVVHIFDDVVSHGYLSVGQFTGLIVVAVQHAREFLFSLFADRLSAHQPHGPACLPFRARAVNVEIQSIACSPTTTSVAVGGRRGELLIYVEVQEAHCFSDHWHHTPLTALAFALDSSAVYTGGREEVLLIWELASYTHKRVKVQLGALQGITPFSTTGTQLLLSCGTSTLAVADLLQMRVTASAEGIEWAAEDVCTGLIVEEWGGSPAVILTGLPNVLRVCDPYTQQSLYSLHISSQMETVPNPPRHGIQFVGVLNESHTLVTYESFSTALPPLLRFWEYNAPRKQHVQMQTVYSPHRSAVLALQVDKQRGRVFTLSCEAMKCWAKTAFAVQDTYSAPAGGWHNHSTMATPSQQVQSMALSADGSICCIADDCLHLYAVQSCKPGERWPLFRILPQYTETQPLHHIVVSADCRHLAAAGQQQIFFWKLDECAEEPTAFSAGELRITALCALTDTTVLAALDDTSLVELYSGSSSANGGPKMGEVVRRVVNASRFPLRHIAPLHANGLRVAAVDAVTGFKVLQLPPTEAATNTQSSTYEWTGTTDDTAGAGAVAGSDNSAHLQLQAFFKDAYPTQGSQGAMIIANEEGTIARAQKMAQADRWLAEVLGEPAYTVPPMCSILSTYLQR
ncbi:hypothetical protein JKF63_03464 [Porcisia hertigi]|uniref:Uncharacterized protein n=1 Tax=Porcisia hertigi TaxID=2761500 RepID=A0A836I8F4_9TRYP|nr:hypothetical protein JKF63_03464 [Porcisia hertigi]